MISTFSGGWSLALVPSFKNPIRGGAGMLKGNAPLADVIVEEHHTEHE